MPERQAIFEHLEEFREATHKTRGECASDMGLSREQYRFMERQEADCKLSTLEKVSQAIGTTVPELLRVKDGQCKDGSTQSSGALRSGLTERVVLAERVRALRNAYGESQEVFAEHIGITVRLLSLIENGYTNPKLSTLQKIAAYTGVTVADLFETDDGEVNT